MDHSADEQFRLYSDFIRIIKEENSPMRFIPEYCIAAAISTVVLLFMYFLKRNYATKSNRLFLAMVLINLFSSVLNIVSIHTISFPASYTSSMRLAVNLAYLWLYNLLAGVFLLYSDSLTRIPRFRKPVLIFFVFVMILNTALIVTSPSTHLIAFFDEQPAYRRGILHPLLYITSYGSILWAALMFIHSGKKFTRDQIISIFCFILGNMAAQVFQIFRPRYVINNFFNTLSLFFIFTTFENQAYYLYRKTQCYNRYAFLNTIRRLQKRRIPYRLTALRLDHIQDSAVMSRRSSSDQLATLLAERLFHSFPGKVYALSNDCFVIIDENRSHQWNPSTLDQVAACFADPYTVVVREEPESLHLSPLIQTMTVTEHFPSGYELMDYLAQSDSFSRSAVSDSEVDAVFASQRREQFMLRLVDEALEHGSFQVWYQPILDVSSGRFRSAEALLRLIDKKEGFINPEELIGAAEKYGRIDAVGLFVFESVCRMIRDRNLPALGVDVIEINLSPRQITNPRLADQLLSLIREYGIPPRSINLEITETAVISRSERDQVLMFMNRLQQEGVTFSLDDYGSGFATISTLLSYPVDLVKFDREILWRAMKDPAAMTLLETSLRSVRGIGKKALVEGVETAEMETMLRENSSDFLQGYLFSRPIPEEKYIEFITEHRS